MNVNFKRLKNKNPSICRKLFLQVMWLKSKQKKKNLIEQSTDFKNECYWEYQNNIWIIDFVLTINAPQSRVSFSYP